MTYGLSRLLKGTIVFTGTVKRVLKDIGMVSYYSSVDHGGTNVVMRTVEDFLNVFNTKLKMTKTMLIIYLIGVILNPISFLLLYKSKEVGLYLGYIII